MEFIKRKTLKRASLWFLAARPKTLAASFAPVIVATAAAFRLQRSPEHINLFLSVLALLTAILIQTGTNLINDALDFRKGADTNDRLGPKRVTQSGLLNDKKVLKGGFICLFLALLCGIPLVQQGGLPILFLGILSLCCSYLYTGGPWPLAYIGLGELFVMIFFGFFAVMGVFFLQTKEIHIWAVILGLQMGLLSTLLIAINNFRDSTEDRKTGKMTLAARFGTQFARAEIICLLISAYGTSLFWCLHGPWLAGILPFFTVPLAWKISNRVLKEPPSAKLNQTLGQAAAMQVLFGLLLTMGFLI